MDKKRYLQIKADQSSVPPTELSIAKRKTITPQSWFFFYSIVKSQIQIYD